ncbi:MAG TPA: TldD/PmbA family protein [candidate division Zixibacteria bacterium]|nr:TldD/PmbA family protein [candidate division Zixibacteria bacterium]
MNNNDRLLLADWVISRAKAHGATEVKVNITNDRGVNVDYRDGKLDRLTEATENSLSLALYIDGKYSSSSTCDIRKETLEHFISEAVAMTRYLDSDPYRTLPDPALYEGREAHDLELYDARLDQVTPEKRVQIAANMEEVARAASDKVTSATAYYYDGKSSSVKVHSNGFQGSQESTNFGSGVEVTVDDGQGHKVSDWSYAPVHYIADLLDPTACGKEAVQRSLRQLGQKKLASGIYDMLVENRAASRMIGALTYPMQASALQQKSSFLEGKLGQKIASDKLTMIDDPFIPRGMGSRLFDGEGIAAKHRTMIDKGVLKHYFVDDYYGRKLGMKPTTGGYSNLTFELGDKNLDQLIAQVKHGIFVTSFVGGNNNSTTGDYSYGIIGMLIEDGALTQPVNEMNISGNTLDLWGSLAEVGNDVYRYSSIIRPSLLFKDISFAGV